MRARDLFKEGYRKLYERACREAVKRGVLVGESVKPENSGYGWYLDDNREVIYTFHKKPIPVGEAPAWLQLDYSVFLDYHTAYTGGSRGTA